VVEDFKPCSSQAAAQPPLMEEIYFAQENRAADQSAGKSIKKRLVEEGRGFIVDLFDEGNTDEGWQDL
jgi:hypothetical protein